MKFKPEAIRGFTLIELIVVLIIIGFIGVLAGSRFENLPATRAYFAIRKLRSDARFAQLLAIETQKKTRVVFNVGSDQYQIERETTPGTWVLATDPASKDDFQVNLNSGDFEGVDLTQAVFNAGSTVVFDAYGAPLDGSANPVNEPANVELNSKFQLRFRAETGKVDIVTL